MLNKEINIFMDYLVLHTGEKYFSLSHVNLWYPYFCQSGVNFIIVTRYIEAYNEIMNEYPDATVVLAKNKEDIDTLFDSIASIPACFYMSNTGNNSHLFYQINSKHIFIGHGDSDKSASAHKYFRAYDENWAAGQAHIDRFKNSYFELNGLEQVIVGRPTLLNTIEKSKEYWRDRFEGNYNLLYLPTWEGTYKEQDYSSLSLTTELISAINNIENIKISVKLHPFTGRRELQFKYLEKEINDLQVIRQVDVEEVDVEEVDVEEVDVEEVDVIDRSENLSYHIQNSNIFICDISAVVSECLAANAPIFLYTPKSKEFNLSKSNMEYSEYCYIFSSIDELVILIESVVIAGNDFLADNRKMAADYIISIENTVNDTFVQKLQDLEAVNV